MTEPLLDTAGKELEATVRALLPWLEWAASQVDDYNRFLLRAPGAKNGARHAIEKLTAALASPVRTLPSENNQ